MERKRYIQSDGNSHLQYLPDSQKYVHVQLNLSSDMTKNQNNDTGSSKHYCDHCPGRMVYDLMDFHQPPCHNHIYNKREDAEQQLL